LIKVDLLQFSIAPSSPLAIIWQFPFSEEQASRLREGKHGTGWE
jgi:hypothetical protein